MSGPVTSQGVVAALKRAGFNRSEPTCAGWKVRKSRATPGYVEVRWLPHPLDLETDEARERRTVRTLLRYADALREAGFQSQLTGNEKLTVHARSR